MNAPAIALAAIMLAIGIMGAIQERAACKGVGNYGACAIALQAGLPVELARARGNRSH